MIDVLVAMPGASAAGGRGARHPAHGEAALGNPRRGIHLLHLHARARAWPSSASRSARTSSAAWSASTRSCRPTSTASPTASRRRSSSRAVHRRRADPRAHLPQRRLRPLSRCAASPPRWTTRSSSVPQVAETTLIGGDRRQLRVQLDPRAAGLAQSQRGRPRADCCAAGQPPDSRRRAAQSDNRGDRCCRPAPSSRERPRTSAASWSACTTAGRSTCATWRTIMRRPGGAAATTCSSARGGSRRARAGRRHPHRRQAARGQRHRTWSTTVLRKVETPQGHAHPGRRGGDRHPRLRRDRRARSRTSCCCTWASPSSAWRCSSCSSSAGASRSSWCWPSRRRWP